jgi:hypothetical protein
MGGYSFDNSQDKWSRALTNARHLLRNVRGPQTGGFWSKVGRAARGGYALGGRVRNAIQSSRNFIKHRPRINNSPRINARPPPPRNNTTTTIVNPLIKLNFAKKMNEKNTTPSAPPLPNMNNNNNKNYVKNANGTNAINLISLEPIPRRYAMELNKKMYNARALKNMVEHGTGGAGTHLVPHSRRPLTMNNLRKIVNLTNKEKTPQQIEKNRKFDENVAKWKREGNNLSKKIKEVVEHKKHLIKALENHVYRRPKK